MKTNIWRYYIQFYKDSHMRLFFAILVSMGQSLFVLPIGFLVGNIFDQIIPQKDFQRLVWIGLGILLLQVASSAISLYVRFVSLRVTKVVIGQIREKILLRFYSFSQAYYSKVDRSKLHAMVVQDTERLDIMSNALISVFIPALAVSITMLFVLFYLNWILSLVLVLVGPLLYWLSRSLRKKVQQYVQRFQRSFEDFSEGMLFVLKMIELTRTFSAEHFETQRQNKKIDQLRTVSERMALLYVAFVKIQEGIISLAGVLILVVGGWAVSAGRMTIGELITFYIVVGLMRTQVRSVSSSIPQIIEGYESLVSLYSLLHIPISTPYNGTEKVELQGEVIFNNVDFQYEQEPILRNINLRIPEKGMIAIVGPNGVGKSSLIHLIMGFYSPQGGELFAGTHSYSHIDMINLRRSFGVVHQDPFLFQGTILENITYGVKDVTEDETKRAAQKATAHEFITQLPDGYGTIIGERGVRLSGGERQRIAIARAFLRDPALLLLDEPTNHLDPAVKGELIANIKSWSQNKAVLIISHNLDIIRQAQFVYRLEHGRIIYSGPSEEYFQTQDNSMNFESVNL